MLVADLTELPRRSLVSPCLKSQGLTRWLS